MATNFHRNKKVIRDDNEDNNSKLEKSITEEEKIEHQLKNLTKNFSTTAVSKLRSGLLLGKARARTFFLLRLKSKVLGTLFGQRRGHVHFAIQEDFKHGPMFLVELAAPMSVLVTEMDSGLTGIALECEMRPEKKGPKLLEEPVWRTHCNGKKCGFTMRRECGPEEWKVLNAIGTTSMGAGVLPGEDSDGEVTYMRGKLKNIED